MSSSPSVGRRCCVLTASARTLRQVAESTVNTVVGKRFTKRQQMRWSKPGAHRMLQTRTRVLDGTLRDKFEQWYPGLAPGDSDGHAEVAIAV